MNVINLYRRVTMPMSTAICIGVCGITLGLVGGKHIGYQQGNDREYREKQDAKYTVPHVMHDVPEALGHDIQLTYFGESRELRVGHLDNEGNASYQRGFILARDTLAGSRKPDGLVDEIYIFRPIGQNEESDSLEALANVTTLTELEQLALKEAKK